MQALNANRDLLTDFAVCINRDNINLAFADNRVLKLTDLIALRQVDIEIVFAVKTRKQINLRVQANAGFHRLLKAKLIYDRQHAGHARINQGHLTVRLRAIFRRCAGKQFGIRRDLRMHFQTQDNFPIPGLALNPIFCVRDALCCEHGINSKLSFMRP